MGVRLVDPEIKTAISAAYLESCPDPEILESFVGHEKPMTRFAAWGGSENGSVHDFPLSPGNGMPSVKGSSVKKVFPGWLRRGSDRSEEDETGGSKYSHGDSVAGVFRMRRTERLGRAVRVIRALSFI